MSLRIKLLLLDNLIWLLVLGFFLINAVFTQNFLTYTNEVNILYHSSILSMLILGQGIVIMIGALDLSLDSILAFAPGLAMLTARSGSRSRCRRSLPSSSHWPSAQGSGCSTGSSSPR